MAEALALVKEFLSTVKSATPELKACVDEIQLLNDILLEFEARSLAAYASDAISRAMSFGR
ncbi:hypothetical protein AJ79_07019 [Helicocarpus griseus UAMH5409]|uniref:Uncharacterized protein n=1 Tax=Helicocarpus griseus UAMH5409 TaxID=1447875 RepID=A0A2B7X7B5_9EURO|nr:hypothetical protein AJ79_07019 [Helicocarpus griseus UAMH5409]